MTITIVPVNQPEPQRGVDPSGVHWAASDSADAPFTEAHAHTEHGTINLTDIKFAGTALADLRLVDYLPWDCLIAGVVAHFANGWEALLLATVADDGAVEAVAIPTIVLLEEVDGVPPQFPLLLSEHLNDLYLNGQIDAVEDNLERILDIALPPDTEASASPGSTADESDDNAAVE